MVTKISSDLLIFLLLFVYSIVIWPIKKKYNNNHGCIDRKPARFHKRNSNDFNVSQYKPSWILCKKVFQCIIAQKNIKKKNPQIQVIQILKCICLGIRRNLSNLKPTFFGLSQLLYHTKNMLFQSDQKCTRFLTIKFTQNGGLAEATFNSRHSSSYFP